MSFFALFLSLSGARLQDYSERGFQYFGSIVGRAGDVDLDGTPDIVLGDSGFEEDAVLPAVWIVSGKDGSVLRSARFPTQRYPQIVVEGDADIDGDRVPDLLVAFQGRGADSNAIYLLSGRTGEILHRIEGCERGPCSTEWVHFVGDRDRDGLPDVAVLCPGSWRVGATIVAYSGISGACIGSFPIENEAGSKEGSFVEVDDADSDGISDWVVLIEADHGHETRFSPPRGPSCVDMQPRTWLRLYSAERRQTLWERCLVGPPSWVSAALVRLGDTNCDRHAELVAGFSDTVVAVDGCTGMTKLRFDVQDKDREQGLGCALAPLGDVNGDAIPDFALGEWDPGMYEGMVAVKSGRDGTELWRVHGSLDDDVHHLGNQLAALGDIDGDGICDLAVGTNEGPDGVAPGLAEVLSGRDGRRLFQFRRRADGPVVSRKR